MVIVTNLLLAMIVIAVSCIAQSFGFCILRKMVRVE